MENLNKDEIFLISTYLNIKDLLNFSICNKNINKNIMRDEVWYYKLKEFPYVSDLEKYPKNKYFSLYSEGLDNIRKELRLTHSLRKIYSFETIAVSQLLKSNFVLTKIPREIHFLINLREVDFSYNGILEIPLSFFKLTNLVLINLTNNHISTIPREISNLKKLEKLDLRWNLIKTLPCLKSLVNLQQLLIFGNQIINQGKMI